MKTPEQWISGFEYERVTEYDIAAIQADALDAAAKVCREPMLRPVSPVDGAIFAEAILALKSSPGEGSE